MVSLPIGGAAAPRPMSVWSRRAAFVLVALLILLPPALPLLLGVKVYWIKPWQMYHYAGLGLLKGEFTIYLGSEPVETLTPLQVLNLNRYPYVKGIMANFGRRAERVEDLPAYAAEVCGRLTEGKRLAYSGHASTLDGWVSLNMDDVCGGAE